MRRKRARARIERSFFKVLMRDFSERLQIPPAFVEEWFDGMPQRVKLYDLFEKSWTVKVKEQRDGGVFLQDGWKTFAQDHSLKLGEFLVFHYRSSGFKVEIYGTDTLMKTADVVRKRHREQRIENGGRRNAETVIDLSEEQTTQYETISVSTSSEVEDVTSKGRRKLPVHKLVEWSRKRQQEQEAELIRRTIGSKPTNPYFLVVMRRSYLVLSYLKVPQNFTKNHLHQDQEIEIKDLNGKSWSVRNAIFMDRKCRRATFLKGWGKFVCENNLKVGDICVFELVSKTTLQVRIFSNGGNSRG